MKFVVVIIILSFIKDKMQISCILSCTIHVLDFNIPNLQCGFIYLNRGDFSHSTKRKSTYSIFLTLFLPTYSVFLITNIATYSVFKVTFLLTYSFLACLIWRFLVQTQADPQCFFRITFSKEYLQLS